MLGWRKGKKQKNAYETILKLTVLTTRQPFFFARNGHNFLAGYSVNFNKADFSLVKTNVKENRYCIGSLQSLPQEVNTKIRIVKI